MYSEFPIVAVFQRGSMQREERSRAITNEQNEPDVVTSTSPASIDVASPATVQPLTDEESHGTRKQAAHKVLKRAQRAQIVTWMVQTAAEVGENHLASKSVAPFPHLFRTSREALLMKSILLWLQIHDFTDVDGRVRIWGTTAHITRTTDDGQNRVRMKALLGRGRKRSPWVAALYGDFRVEFDRLRRPGVKFK